MDKTIKCSCGAEFIWTEAEQSFYAERNMHEPKHCLACRQARKAQKQAPRELVEITCSSCGQKAQVPSPKMVLCRDCFKASKK